MPALTSCTASDALKMKRTPDALFAGKGKEEDTVQEEGGVIVNARGTEEVQGPSDEVYLCKLIRSQASHCASWSQAIGTLNRVWRIV